jgi:hypothetical protein
MTKQVLRCESCGNSTAAWCNSWRDIETFDVKLCSNCDYEGDTDYVFENVQRRRRADARKEKKGKADE